MSLNSVVNNLVRAAAGIPFDISDSDLDRHVAELLAAEAKVKEKSWSQLGLSAFLGEGRDSPDPNLPRPNKRFLASVIRTVDGHNSALLRAQAQAARDVRSERGESSRSGARRLFGGAMRSVGRERGGGVPRVRDDAQPRDASRSRDDRRRGRDEEEEMNGSRGERRKEPSYMDDRERERHGRRELDRRRRDYSDEDEDRERRYRRDDRSHRRERSGRDEDRRRHHESSNETRRIRRDDATNEGSRSGLGTKDVGRSSAKPANGRCANGHGRPASSPPPSALSPPQEDPPPPPTPLPPPPPALSKMDKYFTHEYDPRLDLGEVPKEGFVGEVGWDNMLAILKERGKKRRHHSPTLSDDPLDIPAASAIRATSPPARRLEKPRKERKRRTWSDESEDEREREKRKEKRRAEKQREKALTTTMTTEGAADGKGMFDMAYVKKGGVREWDVGK